jgi:aspartate/tyrosine/aromatic aminotransferase
MDKFRNDHAATKTDLMMGVYKTDEGKAHVLSSVKKVRSVS